ncbi:cation transporter [Candidatus Falkowbacteria bacterium CG10_big_fil_rev_8_21_14_0_10_39_9]|uniref:Cation transporter n=1 Tax=Candidatus Falkowbacteria bacterium CG10_big_fil_rev_8_21_14_0_10_39_9 TaxID=1974566 RepID=A0A2M6WPT8_9BACT|nr:MAG: cation transporter [Candidatus Falkowbacteria bacterium CG10_big_fil_rev_8_21_14_0_10_39_9]
MAEHNHSTASKNLVWSIGINVIIVVFEILFGLLSRSFALISDALHNVTDIGSMILSLWGEKLADKPQTEKKTYGYKRAEILIAFVNGGVLLGVVGFVLVEAIIRLFKPEPVSGMTMVIVAGVALLGNGLATYLLQKGANKNLNLRSAWLHSLQDALFSLGVVVSAAIIYFTGWNWLDSLASIIISVFLLKEIFSILLETINMLMDSVPADINFAAVKSDLLTMFGVIEINDLHIWQTSSENILLSAHLKIKELNAEERIKLITNIQNFLEKQYHINHTTLQMVSAKEAEKLKLNCNHCN